MTSPASDHGLTPSIFAVMDEKRGPASRHVYGLRRSDSVVEKLTRGILFQQVIQHVARLHERAAPSYVTNRMLVPNNGVARGAQGPNLLSASRACMFPGFRRNTMPIFSWSSFDSAVSNDVDTRCIFVHHGSDSTKRYTSTSRLTARSNRSDVLVGRSPT